MYELPLTVNVFDREYKIRNKGDYRIILEAVSACQNPDFTKEEQALTALILFYDNVDTTDDVLNEFETSELLQEAIHQMMLFISGGEANTTGFNVNYKLVDWQQDERLIVSAINPMLGQGLDVRFIKYMHWWTFLSYYMGIKESALSTVVGIRGKIAKGKKLEKYEQDFKRDNPHYFNFKQIQLTQEEKELENYIKSMWEQ